MARVSRCYAHLRLVVRLYDRPSHGTSYERRAAAGDRTVLYDALTVTIDELQDVRDQIGAAMDAGIPTAARPGTEDKVRAMRERVIRGESLWQTGDSTE